MLPALPRRLAPILSLLFILSCGFTNCKNIEPQKGGRGGIPGMNAGRVPPGVAVTNVDELVQRVEQPENPKDATTNNRKETERTELPIPAGSTIKIVTSEPGSTNKSETSITTSTPTVFKKERTLDAGQSVGAAQKDTGREVMAKLAGMKTITLVVVGFGIFLIVAGAAMFHPYLLPVFPSKSFKLIVIGAGVLCVLAALTLPMLIVGNETLLIVIMAGLVFFLSGVAGVWWFVSHHYREKDASYESGYADANHDGIDDRQQTTAPAS